MTSRSLMVLVPDRVSEWVRKGEVVDRYLNPGDLFDRVDLVLTNDDRPDPAALARMGGRASVHVHNLPAGAGRFAVSLGWRPTLLRGWARGAVDLARSLQPSLVRCHGVWLNVLAASEIKRELGIPYVVSVHSNPDLDQQRGRSRWRDRAVGRLVLGVERTGIGSADVAVAVYSTIVPYLERLRAPRVEVLYNVVGHRATPKPTYDLETPGRIQVVCVGRQHPDEKDPTPLMEAVERLPHVHLHLVGDGPLHDTLLDRARRSTASDRIHFTRALPNHEVLRLLSRSDVFAYCTSIHEVSKGCIEAALTGLPIVANDSGGHPAAEVVGDHVWLVDGSVGSYVGALQRLAVDAGERERLGRAAYRYASERWDPAVTEARWAELYRDLLRI